MTVLLVKLTYSGSDFFYTRFTFEIGQRLFFRRQPCACDFSFQTTRALRRPLKHLLNGHKDIAVRRCLIQAKHLFQYTQKFW